MMTEVGKHRHLRQGLLATAGAVLLLAGSAWADLDGHGPDAWRVRGVAANDVLNARMGPGTDYAVIATFASGERGLQQVTCVPLVPQATWMQMTQGERSALPQAWCLMRSQDLSRAGWVAQRYLREDGGTRMDAPPPSPAGAANAPAPAATTAAADNPSDCIAPAISGGTARTPASLFGQIQHDTDGFTAATGFQPLDVDAGPPGIDWDRVYSSARFPTAGQSALMPDANMGAVARAMLVFDAMEDAVPHARYHVTYHLRHVSDDCEIIPTAYVQVTRYNLGGARYQEVIQYVDKAFWPPREAFGTAPHVSWRLAMGMVQGRYADIRQAGRRVVADDAAAAADCLGQPCLALEDATGPSGRWQTVQPAALPAAVYLEPDHDWAPGPVRMAEMLYAQAVGSPENIEASETTSFERPDMTQVISRDVQGQDSNMHGLLQWQGLMDDAVPEIWLRTTILPGDQSQWQELSLPGR